MKTFVSLKATTSVVLLLALSHVTFAQEQCSKCTAAPTAPCDRAEVPPAKGGPPCLCTGLYPAPGCIMSPCADQGTAEFCDSSAGYGSVEGRDRAFSQKCTENKDQCECCKSYPKDCTADSKPPQEGGDACTCSGIYAKPAGCILRPCRNATDMYCICNKDFPDVGLCFSSPCPGNADETVTDTCEHDSSDGTPEPGTDTTPGDDGNGGGGDNNSGSSALASFQVLFAGIAVIFMRMA